MAGKAPRAGFLVPPPGVASDGIRSNSSRYGYSSTMTQEADRSPVGTGASVVRGSAKPPAAPGTGQQLSPDATRGAAQAHGSGRKSGAGRQPKWNQAAKFAGTTVWLGVI